MTIPVIYVGSMLKGRSNGLDDDLHQNTTVSLL
jgi:hypothetical protein